MAVYPVTRRGSVLAIGVLAATIGLVGAGFLVLTMPAAAAPPSATAGASLL